MAALLTRVVGETGKTIEYITECKRLNIQIVPPHVNKSFERFVSADGSVIFSLLGIKNIGRALIEKTVAERSENGEFASFWDFCKRVYGTELNRRALEALIKSGALDSLGLNRREMTVNSETALQAAAKEKELYAGGQLDMFGTFGGAHETAPHFKNSEDFTLEERLGFEKEMSGLYFSGHPLERYREVFKRLHCDDLNTLKNSFENGENIEGKAVNLIAVVASIKKKVTKRDEIMAFCEIEDLGASAEMIVFPKTLAIFSELVAVGTALFIKGRVSLKDDEIKIIPDSLALASDSEKAEISTPNEEKQSETKKKKRVGIFIKTAKSDEKKRKKAETLISIFSGNFPVYFYITEEKRYEFAGERLLTSPNEPMLKELKHIFGDENVVFRS